MKRNLFILSFAVFMFALPVAAKNSHIWTDGTVQPNKVRMPDFSDLAKQKQSTVVNIYSTSKIRMGGMPMFGDPWFRFFFGGRMPRERVMERKSLGSGIIINAKGYILTNHHVIAGADEVMVKTASGRKYKAKVIGSDKRMDLALLKIKPKENLNVAPLGDSSTLKVGQWVVAIGNPFGLSYTVTAGIVSAKNRVIGEGPYDDFIQTDASINPGNSGGPLFDTAGNVVGINTAIRRAAQGIGFAVPVNMAKQFIREILTHGRMLRGWLGVGIQALNDELSRALGLKGVHGVLVSQVFRDSPASKAGFKHGDVITEYNGHPVREPVDLTRLVGLTEPGTKVEIKVIRDNKTLTLTPVISTRTGEEVVATGTSGKVSGKGLGLEVSNCPRSVSRRLGIKGGVVIKSVKPGSPADRQGLRPGDVIVEVNRKSVRNVQDFQRLVRHTRKGQDVLLLVARHGNLYYAVISTD